MKTKKQKDPSLQIYTAQFLADTQFWPLDQRGMYITLICVHHQTEYIPRDIMLQICQTPDPEKTYPLMMRHFGQDKNGNYLHLETQKEITRRKDYSRSQSHRAIRRWSDATAYAEEDATAYAERGATAYAERGATAYAESMPRDKTETNTSTEAASIETIRTKEAQTLNSLEDLYLED